MTQNTKKICDRCNKNEVTNGTSLCDKCYEDHNEIFGNKFINKAESLMSEQDSDEKQQENKFVAVEESIIDQVSLEEQKENTTVKTEKKQSKSGSIFKIVYWVVLIWFSMAHMTLIVNGIVGDAYFGSIVVLIMLVCFIKYYRKIFTIMVKAGIIVGTLFLIYSAINNYNKDLAISILSLVGLVVLYRVNLSFDEFNKDEHSPFENDKGYEGESRTTNEINGLDVYYKLVNNVVIGEGQKTTEIDHILITNAGIYVIETKNYSGWIFGSLNQKMWVQTFQNREKYEFYSPIKQNQSHINSLRYVLKDYLGWYDTETLFKSIIVFSDQAVLKSIPINSDKLLITQTSNLKSLLNKSIKYNIELLGDATLSNELIDEIYEYLVKYVEEGKSTIENHIDNYIAKQRENH